MEGGDVILFIPCLRVSNRIQRTRDDCNHLPKTTPPFQNTNSMKASSTSTYELRLQNIAIGFVNRLMTVTTANEMVVLMWSVISLITLSLM